MELTVLYTIIDDFLKEIMTMNCWEKLQSFWIQVKIIFPGLKHDPTCGKIWGVFPVNH